MSTKRFNNNNILCISDIHAPYHHKDVIPFLTAIKEKYEIDRVIQMGDITDSYCFSRYPKDMDHTDTYSGEYRKVRKFIAELVELFPEGIALKGNHDARAWDRAKLAGIPKEMILPYERVIGLEDTNWKMVYDYQLTVDATRESWYFAHTRSSNALISAKAIGMNVVFGHEHTKFAADSFQTPEKKVWGVTCGCLIGDDRTAFGYNRQSLFRPNRGLVLIVRGVPKMIPFVTGSSGNWNRVVA